MSEAFDEASLREALEQRLAAFEASGGRNLSYLQDKGVQGTDITRDPLYVIWDGDPKFAYTVRYALAVWNVVGILNNPPGHDFYGLKFSSEDEFRAVAARQPRLSALVLVDNPTAASRLCGELGVPWVDSPFAQQLTGEAAYINRTTGTNCVVKACVPHVRDNLSIIGSLADDLSRRTLLATQLYRISRQAKWLWPIIPADEDMYFHRDLIRLTPDAVFVDGGASLGDTVERFHAVTGGSYGHIHAFEPSPVGAGLMRRNFAGDSRISIHQLGLAERGAAIGFTDVVCDGVINGAADSSSSDKVQVTALDELGLGRVDFIKMDIEGFEVPALKGARDTIARWRPAMAICAYHKPNDMAMIHQTVRDIRPDYKCYLRHYAPTEGDSVFYFV